VRDPFPIRKRNVTPRSPLLFPHRLDIAADTVKCVYVAASRLRMDRAALACASFLRQHMDTANCLELRALPGVSSLTDLVKSVDAFIEANVDELVANGRELASLERIRVEVLHARREELEMTQARSLSQLVLDWVHREWLEDDRLTLDALKAKTHLLFLSSDHALDDCEVIAEGSANDSEIVQDYKQTNAQQAQAKAASKKVPRHSNLRPAKPRELLYSRHINQDDEKTEDRPEDWKVIACASVEGLSILALVTVDGHLFACSIIQRVNRPTSPAQPHMAAEEDSLGSPVNLSRPPSQEKDIFALVATMGQAKCAPAACLDDKLIVCGKCRRATNGSQLSTQSRPFRQADSDAANAWAVWPPTILRPTRGRTCRPCWPVVADTPWPLKAIVCTQ